MWTDLLRFLIKGGLKHEVVAGGGFIDVRNESQWVP